ncbi:uncharacterized protein LOC114944959 [Nylanderia fulva]|uniref:uncharacterized protein LOC114944959 n=1 Tax=Nylanderia fulva TaxID=613905 RepID=UPI0010FB047D|nr:uncharacterized protein LOC114944959 [Nylanderia fulva]
MNENDRPIGKYGHVFNMEPSSKFEPTTAAVAEVHRHATGEAMTELGEVKVTLPGSSIATSTPHTSGGEPAPCKNGGCKVWRSNRNGEQHSESPWHSLKTIFLVSVIVAFLLWVIVYTLLNQYQIL